MVLREEHAATARRILSTRDLLAPHLLWAEIGNTLWKRHRRLESSTEEVRRMLGEIQQLPVITFPHWPLLPEALDLAISLEQTVYDCLYLALAEARDSVMVTADRRFHDVVSESVWSDRIVWIEDVT
jgi:predicted nucleic acid-binding protein